ncbi:uncharacterized protein LOC134275044 [Saccostrea cucullata]|uniref:uncharacterized protein LOC134275044 n=1 Tax=Saccostrea cuccullata TaxID=36930 RepID=UPI002ED46DE6
MGHVVDKISPIGLQMCLKECLARSICASLNFYRKQLQCELSSSTGDLHPTDIVQDPEYVYVEMKKAPKRYFEECSESCSSESKCVKTASGPVCVKSDCPRLHPDRGNTSVVVTSTAVGTVLNYHCSKLPNVYVYVSLNSTCLPNGTWTSQLELCSMIKDCLNFSSSCWYQYNVTVDNSWNNCSGGITYIRKTAYTSMPLVAVMLCNSTRYKIFGGQSLTDTFLNIADGSGSGADHCELVGGSEGNAHLAGDYPYAPVVTGYYHSHFGGQFMYGDVSYRINSYFYNSWYECGVTVP